MELTKFLKCGSIWRGKLATSLALDANDMTCLMMVDRVSMAPLLKSSLLLFDKWKCPAALLLPPGLDR